MDPYIWPSTTSRNSSCIHNLIQKPHENITPAEEITMNSSNILRSNYFLKLELQYIISFKWFTLPASIFSWRRSYLLLQCPQFLKNIKYMPSIFHTWQKPVKHLLFVANISCFGEKRWRRKKKTILCNISKKRQKLS